MTGNKMLVTLWVTVMLSALTVIYVSHNCRLLFTELAQLQQRENNLQVVWGQYLLEQSSLANLSRIETKAITELGMQVPAIKDVVMVQP
ncbi:MAG: cell division protein FtsL [Porticoccaceae bacterium]